ncbi:branched-chain amino acid transport system II carrier protein [Candidatus Pantoea edessiphila]|uniref:Branched-chain amino acid transport system carrier protein n=1 Tax=Candidatus Pantoea edessiphila TaxID=2044610 RepID=A0A2P5SVJ3_9GAMM|nr:branched-chain amino acid transport system II carrier protein [Candidatus Pantoea edessiphila]PPI86349.1 branched-chain amino acid transport system II carrier protein [Candidatus Pantoea edessiphila]
MIYQLSLRDVLALGFMTFALFVGAGNIVFPPMVGIQSGEYIWIAAIGFLITAVGLPICTIIALARSGGGIEVISSPIGKIAGLILATICYLLIGPLFAIPRTATISFEVGFLPLVNNHNGTPLLLYSIIYFLCVTVLSLYPSKLLDIIGYFLAPVKIIALIILSLSVFICHHDNTSLTLATATQDYQKSAFCTGFLNGYLTMDTLGALVFGVVIVNAIKSRGIKKPEVLVYYTIMAGLISSIGLTIVYLGLLKLGSSTNGLVNQHADGATILNVYVNNTFGYIGSVFLAILIFIACILTAVGLTCAWVDFVTKYFKLSYKSLVCFLSLFSMLISNLGLDFLIKLSIPILTIIYPPCIILVVLSFTLTWWYNNTRVFIPTILISLIFSTLDALKFIDLKSKINLLIHWPLINEISWLLPTITVLIIAGITDRIIGLR